jgi:hypothetical protein
LVAAIGVVFSGYLAANLLTTVDGNPTIFLKFGEDSPETEYGLDHFDDLVIAPFFGHDGKYYLMQAMDPFYLNPAEHAGYLDRPTYRAQRMVYPTVAGGFGLLPATVTAWSLLLVNLVVVGIGSGVTAMVARLLGLNPLFGLAFALNPGVFLSTILDTTEAVALAALMTSIYFVLRNHVVPASVAMTVAVLSRETMVLAAVGLVAYLWSQRRSAPLRWQLVLPFAVPAAWWLYLRIRIGYLSEVVQDTSAIGLPVQGFIDTMRFWLANPGNLADIATGITLMFIAIAVIVRCLRAPTLLSWMAVGHAGIAVVMTMPVWEAYFDSVRVLAPLITIYILMVPSEKVLHRRNPIPAAASPVHEV